MHISHIPLREYVTGEHYSQQYIHMYKCVGETYTRIHPLQCYSCQVCKTNRWCKKEDLNFKHTGPHYKCPSYFQRGKPTIWCTYLYIPIFFRRTKNLRILTKDLILLKSLLKNTFLRSMFLHFFSNIITVHSSSVKTSKL